VSSIPEVRFHQEDEMTATRKQGPSRRHHFLPQSYLMHWADPATIAPKRTPEVWRITKDGRAHHYPPASHVFWRQDGNNIERPDGSQDDRLEELLARIEDVVAEATRGPISRKEIVSRDQFDAVNMFFSSMIFRVPAMQASLRSSIEARARIERETMLSHGRPVPPDNVQLVRNGPVYATLDSLFVIQPELDQMTHTLLVAPDGEHFVTSDRPAVLHADIGPAGLANRLCEATLPLSPKVLLLLWWGDREKSGYCPADADMVLTMNRRTVAHCDQWFINSSRSFDLRWLPAPPTISP